MTTDADAVGTPTVLDGRPLDQADYTRVAVDGLTFHVYVRGEGPTVLLLHGLPANSQEFRYTAPALVAAGFRVVVPDLLGAGGSDRPDDVALYTIRKDYEHVLGIVNQLGIDTFDIVCQDRGATTGWSLAARHPDRVRRVVSTTVGHLNGSSSSGIEQRERSWYLSFFQFDLAEEALRADDWALFRAWLRHHPETDAWIAELSRTPNGLRTGALNVFRANYHPDRQPERAPLPRVGAPVLMIYTDNDPYLGLEQLAASTQHLDGPLHLVRIDGAGHFVSVTAPIPFNRAVLNFLQAGEVSAARTTR